jgi:hypothetical protein
VRLAALLTLVISIGWAAASEPIVTVPFDEPVMGFRLLIPHDWDFALAPGDHRTVTFGRADIIGRYVKDYYAPTSANFVQLRSSAGAYACAGEPDAVVWEVDGQPACRTEREAFDEMAGVVMVRRAVHVATPNHGLVVIVVDTCRDCQRMLDVFDAMVASLSWLDR